MGIGQFRREVQRWLNGSLFSAQQDAESESRMPTVVDPVGIIGQRVVDDVEESLSESRPGSRANAPAQATGQLRRALAEINVKTPGLLRALDQARGVCAKFRNEHPSGRRCNKGDKCPFLHVKRGQDLLEAKNRCHAPFTHMTRDNKILVVPPLMKAVQYWWRHMLQQETDCPVTGVDVLREGDSLVVLLTLSKPLPSSLAQDSSAKYWLITGDGTQINASTVAIPEDRMWWHATQMADFGDILRDSLRAGHQGNFKGVYSFTDWEKCAAYGGQVVFAFRSDGMIAKLSKDCCVPKHIPEGVIGYFDSAGKRQWVHHPRNLQLKYARVEFHTFCTYFSEAFEKLHGEHHYSPELHTALVNIAGLVESPSNGQCEYDYDGPYGT